MSNDARSTAEIERDIENERAALTRSLDALQERFTVEGIARQVTDQVTRHGGEFGHSVSRSVKDNPMALALTGIGLAWMMYGDSRRTGADGAAGGHTASATGEKLKDGARGASDTAGKAADTAGKAAASASQRWDRMTAEVDRNGRRMRASADDMRRRLNEGTENMSEAARQRVVEAREAAYRAQLRAEQAAGHGRKEVVDFFNDEPLVVGALAIAVGAALGSSLPRTRAEDEAVGDYSDQVFEEAERIFHEESAKAREVASVTVAEARNVAKEEKAKADSKAPGDKSVAQAARDEARAATKRVAGTARKESEKQGLGKPKR